MEYWQNIYDLRSPIDKVDDRYLESIHNRDYNNYYLDQLFYGTDKEKRECYYTDRDYPLSKKNGWTALMLSAENFVNLKHYNGGHTTMIKFVIGMMIGGAVGFFTAALLAAAKRGDTYEV